jgi:glycosyltransferase involved in cell wall biosynthesis
MRQIAVYSPVPYEPWESYGLIALQLVKHLLALGVNVSIHGPGQAAPILSTGGIVLGPPDSFAAQGELLRDGPHIAITMFESSRIPSWWVAPLNACRAVIVPSWFCVDAFRQSGVTSPIHVIPLGVDELYQYKERLRTQDSGLRAGIVLSPQSPVLSQGRSPLTFLAFLDRGERKGGQMAVQAFLRAFGDDERYRLILKGRAATGTSFTFTNPNIEVIQHDMEMEELLQLYYRCDVLISAAKGEGFGMLPREFAASGGLALATDWSGTAEGLNQWGWPLPYRLVPATWSQNKAFAGQSLGEWAELDPAQVAEVLLHVAENWAGVRLQLPRKAQTCRDLYSWRAFAAGVLAVWENVTADLGLLTEDSRTSPALSPQSAVLSQGA